MEYQTEESFVCKECGGTMHRLPGSVQSIYVCRICGFSSDTDNMVVQKPKDTNDLHKKQFLMKNLFTDQFMKKYTRFPCLSDFLDACKLVKKGESELNYTLVEYFPKRKWNSYIRDNTCFETWNQMFEKAVEVYLRI